MDSFKSEEIMKEHTGKIFLLYLLIIAMGIFFCDRISKNLYEQETVYNTELERK